MTSAVVQIGPKKDAWIVTQNAWEDGLFASRRIYDRARGNSIKAFRVLENFDFKGNKKLLIDRIEQWFLRKASWVASRLAQLYR